MQKIIPHLWLDKEAVAAAKLYTSVFPRSHLTNVTTLHDTPSGDADIVSFDLNGFQLMAISGGPIFRVNPSISFMLNFDPSKSSRAKADLDTLWGKLKEGGKVLMPLQEYPFSKRYGWLEDKYGVSWQLILTNPTGDERPFMVPSLLFVGEAYSKAEAAVDFYLSVFKVSSLGQRLYYPPHAEPNQEGTVMFSDFKLFETWFTAMDGSGEHKFAFNEAISFIVKCDSQAEIDDYWQKPSAVPEAEQCGWLKDKYGVSWQIVPTVMEEMMSQGTPEQINRLTQALLPMKKLDISKLVKAYEGEQSMTRLNPYLSFKGQAKGAMEFYQTVFGGKLTLTTFKEGGIPTDKSEENLIMHAMLEVNDTMVFMGADTPEHMEYLPGKNMSLSLSGENVKELKGYWDKLAEGATIEQPLNQAPWGDTFGMLTDKFGIRWMVNITVKKN